MAEQDDSSGAQDQLGERIFAPCLLVGAHVQPERLGECGRETEQLVDTDGRSGEGGDAAQTVEPGAAQVDRGASRVREVGAGQIAAVEGEIVELRADELGAGEHRPVEPDVLQLREPEVRVVQLAGLERDMTQVRLRKLDRRRAAVDEVHPLPDRLGEVATRQVTAHQVDVDESSAFERLAGMAGVDHPQPERLTVVVQLERRRGHPVR